MALLRHIRSTKPLADLPLLILASIEDDARVWAAAKLSIFGVLAKVALLLHQHARGHRTRAIDQQGVERPDASGAGSRLSGGG